MYCPECGKEIKVEVKFCPHCGFNISRITSSPQTPPSTVEAHQGAPRTGVQPKSKNWLAALLLSTFLGSFGADRFYLGYTTLGIVKLLTLGGFGLWSLIDCLLIGLGRMKDANGMELEGREGNEWIGYIVVALVILSSLIYLVLILFMIIASWL